MTDDPTYTRAELQRKLKVCGDTLTRWRREKRLPPPDIAPTRKTQQWRASTLRAAGLI